MAMYILPFRRGAADIHTQIIAHYHGPKYDERQDLTLNIIAAAFSGNPVGQ